MLFFVFWMEGIVIWMGVFMMFFVGLCFRVCCIWGGLSWIVRYVGVM